MPDSSEQLHESPDELSPETVDRHRAIVSLREELEAVDWYDQRVDAAGDSELRAILTHNRDEEKEHAAMMLEWLRRRDPTFDEMLKTYLFTDGDISTIEESESGGTSEETSGAGSLGIGSLRGEGQP